MRSWLAVPAAAHKFYNVAAVGRSVGRSVELDLFKGAYISVVLGSARLKA